MSNANSEEKDVPSTPHTLLSIFESHIAFAQLFIAVARRAYNRGEHRLGDHARFTADSAYRMLSQLLPSDTTAIEKDFSAELSALRQALDELQLPGNSEGKQP